MFFALFSTEDYLYFSVDARVDAVARGIDWSWSRRDQVLRFTGSLYRCVCARFCGCVRVSFCMFSTYTFISTSFPFVCSRLCLLCNSTFLTFLIQHTFTDSLPAPIPHLLLLHSLPYNSSYYNTYIKPLFRILTFILHSPKNTSLPINIYTPCLIIPPFSLILLFISLTFPVIIYFTFLLRSPLITVNISPNSFYYIHSLLSSWHSILTLVFSPYLRHNLTSDVLTILSSSAPSTKDKFLP